MSSDAENMEAAAKIMKAFQDQTNMLQNSSNPSASGPVVGTNEFDNQGGDFAEPGNGNTIGMGFDNQGTLDPSLQPPEQQPMNTPVQPPVQPQPVQPPVQPAPQQVMQPPPQQVSSPATAPMPAQRGDVCPECNTMHPPLRPGEKCPNVGVGDAGLAAGIDDATINKHLVDLRNIIISKMSSKGIKNGKKFFQYAVIELTKALEVYNE